MTKNHFIMVYSFWVNFLFHYIAYSFINKYHVSFKRKRKRKDVVGLDHTDFFLFSKRVDVRVNPNKPSSSSIVYIHLQCQNLYLFPIKKRKLPPNFGPSQFLLVCLSLHSPFSIIALANLLRVVVRDELEIGI